MALVEKKRKRGDNTKKTSREINREELKRYLSERGKVSHIFDLLEKVDDLNNDMEPIELQRVKLSIDTRLSLLKKYLPDEKSVEVKNEEGGTFKTDSKWQIEFINAQPQD